MVTGMLVPVGPRRCFLLALFLGAGAGLRAVPRLPLEDFVRQSDYSDMRISGDGTHVAFLHEYDGRSTLYVCDLATMGAQRFDLGMTQAFGTVVPKEVTGYQWIGDRRLLMTTTVWDAWFGTKAVNQDGTDWEAISGYETLPLSSSGILVNVNVSSVLWARRVIYSFDDAHQDILMLDQHDSHGKDILFPDVLKVDTLNGFVRVEVKNPGNVVGWGVDHSGRVRIGLVSRGGLHFGLIYRGNDRSPWRKLDMPGDLRSPEVLGFDQSNEKLYVAALTPEKRMGLYEVTLGRKPAAHLLLSDPEYDMIPGAYTPEIDGVPMARMVFSGRTKRLLGVWYLRDAPRVRWFDPRFQAYQRAIDRALPNTINLYVNKSKDGRRILFLAFSDRDPGTYYLLDAGKHTIRRIAACNPQIHPAQMAQMLDIHYASRDGLRIHGYLTLPVGYPPKHLPLIVMPHGGPWIRDAWGYDPLVQFLANRGYAVLQMNYRGSPGYGRDFYRKGRREVGLAIQDDIEDGTKWAIAAGVADPKRVAILGASYGGYSALFALGRSPGVYRCGISLAGVTDWYNIYKNLKDPEYEFSRRFWHREIGNPRTDAAFLKSISPVHFAASITAPVLIIQGREDRTVPPKQAREMIDALERAGHKPESMFLSGTSHAIFASQAVRRKIFAAIEKFLVKNLGPGVPPARG